MKRILLLLCATSSIFSMERAPLSPRLREIYELRATVRNLETRVRVAENFATENIAGLELQQGYLQDEVRVQQTNQAQHATRHAELVSKNDMRHAQVTSRLEELTTENAELKTKLSNNQSTINTLQYAIYGLGTLSILTAGYLFYQSNKPSEETKQIKSGSKGKLAEIRITQGNQQGAIAEMQKAQEAQQAQIDEALKKINRTIPKVKELQDNQPYVAPSGNLHIPVVNTNGQPNGQVYIKQQEMRTIPVNGNFKSLLKHKPANS